MANSSAKGQRVFVTNAAATGGSGITDAELRATPVPVSLTSANVTLDAGDLQIGAVEIKDATSTDRVSVSAANIARTTGTMVLATQAINAAGEVLSTSALATSVKQPALGTSTAPSADVITTQRPSVTQVVSTALEASKVLKASAGQLVQLSVFNSKASAQFILLMNATSLPGNGAVTLLYPPIPIAAASLLVLDIPAPLVASTGIVAANSSTGTFSLTVGSADCAFFAQIN